MRPLVAVCSTDMLPHEVPLVGFHRSIGGSAGEHTHGGTKVAKPENMPSRDEADYIVTNYDELKEGLRDENAISYIGDHIHVENKPTIYAADGVQLVGQYCDPEVSGTGYWIRHRDTEDNNYSRKVIQHGYGKPMKLWGVYGLGPRLHYFDPKHTTSKFEEMTSSFLHEYAGKEDGLFEAHGCRFTGWTLAGLEIGAKGYRTNAEIHRSTFTRNIMEHLGYGIEHYNGDIWVDRSFFDHCRHGFSGFGYPTELVDITECVIGPGPWAGHALDMHCLANNIEGSEDTTAGGYVRIRNCSIMSTRDVRGYKQEGFALRGVSADQSKIFNNKFWHPEKPNKYEPNTQGAAWRQESVDVGWPNIKIWNNIFGENARQDGIGAPKANEEKGLEDGEKEPETEPPESTKPEKTLKQPTQTLTIEGTGPYGQYWIFVKGEAKRARGAERNDVVNTEDRTVINGHIAGYKDRFELGKDTKLVGAWFTGPAIVRVDGNVVQEMPSLIAAETSKRVG